MGIQSNDTNAGAAQPQSAAPQPEATQAHAQPRATRQPIAGVQSLTVNHGRRLGRNNVGEYVKKMNEAFNVILEASPFKDDTRVLVVDQQTYGLAYSLLVLTHRATGGKGQPVISAHVMIAAGSAPALTPRMENCDGRQIEIRPVPGDIINAVMWEAVKSVVTIVCGPESEVFNAGVSVLPAELRFDDEVRVGAVLDDAFESVIGVMDNLRGDAYDPLTAAAFDRTMRISARLECSPQPLFTSAGEPVRSDINLQITATNVNQQDPNVQPTHEIASLDGFIDLVYAAPERQMLGQVQTTQHFYPRLVLTNIRNSGEITLESQLLALSTSRVLAANYNWAAVYRPTVTHGRDAGTTLNLRDIGAISYDMPELTENNVGGKIETRTSAFTDEAFFTLIAASVRPELLYSIDVDEVGPMSWVQLPFVEASRGNQGAYALIYDAANRLTAGRFGQMFPLNTPITTDDNNRIALGNYPDRDGNLVDIRNVDYLAALNYYGDNDINAARSWDETYNPTRSMAARMDARFRLMAPIVGDRFKITGYAQRVTFTPAFIDALANACQAAGLNINMTNLQHTYGTTNRRSAAQFAGMGVSGVQMPGYFQQGGQGPNIGGQTTQYNQGGAVRW